MARAADTPRTPVDLIVGDQSIPATLNSTLTARSFEEKLPFTITLQRYETDYCAPAAPLPSRAQEAGHGWSNGDIGYFGGWFTLLFDGEEDSRATPGVMIIGSVDPGHLGRVRGLDDVIRVTVDRRDDAGEAR